MSFSFAQRVGEMQSSAIREILKVTEEPDMISFAGGLPAPELFPIAEMRAAFNDVLAADDAPSALQYSTTEGFQPLREHLAGALKERGITARPADILLTCGSQQALDLVAKVLLDPGDTVLLERPSYLGAIQVFQSYQTRFATVATDEHGIIAEALEEAIITHHPKLLYVIPAFMNPTGITMSLERRRAVCALLEQYRIPAVEDDPYGELRFTGEPVPTLKSFDRQGWVIYLSTVSKTIAPGLRLGWVAAEQELMAKLVQAKQGVDLHTGTLTQRAVHHYLAHSDAAGHVKVIREEYGRRRDAMIGAMERTFPASVQWTRPEGGMFLWVTLPSHVDSTELLPRAIGEKVAYVPGAPFFADGGGQNHMRLNFSNSPIPVIEDGIGRLARLLASSL